MKVRTKSLAIAAVVVTAALATMAESSSSGDGDTIIDPTGSSSQSATDGSNDDQGGGDSGQGTRENPAPLGSVARVGDWEISVVKVNTDAAKIVADENQFNEPPKAGYNFVLWEVEATYVGEESGELWLDTTWQVVGSAGNSFDESCGVIPNDISDAGETFSGATVKGNECVGVEKAQLDGATIMVESLFAVESDRTFFALK